ncbi:hypothetical protein OMF50_16030, partial [Bordetella pertussis]
PRHRARCTHLQTQPGRIQPIDSSQLGRWTRMPRGAGPGGPAHHATAQKRWRRPTATAVLRTSSWNA